jgi:hypothetical protein
MRIPVRVLVGVFALALPSLAQAGPINFNPSAGLPDIKTNPTAVTYRSNQVCPFVGNAPGGCLPVAGDDNTLKRFVGDTGLAFNAAEPNGDTLLAAIDSAGAFHGGRLTGVGGVAAPYNVSPRTRDFTGVLSQLGLGMPAGGLNDTFNFLAAVTDPLGRGFGSLAGIVVTTSGDFVNDANPFVQNFGLPSSAVPEVDTFMQAAQVPEPRTLLLLTIGGVILVLIVLHFILL